MTSLPEPSEHVVSLHAVTKDGIANPRPDREALTGAWIGRLNGHARSNGSSLAAPSQRGRRRGRRGEPLMVPEAQFASYYGMPVINKPVWASPDIPGYLFLGGLAGASSVLAAGSQLSGRPSLARVSKLTAAGAIGLSLAALVHDLGRPSRFYNMLRVFKPTSPMSVGSWLLSAYAPAAAVAAVTEVTGLFPVVGAAATAGAAALGPAVASYTAALISDTAVPAWHDGFREMPFLFVSSAASAGGGLGLAAAPLSESAPARRMAVAGALTEMVLSKAMEHRMPPEVAEAYHSGKAGIFMKAAEGISALGVAGAVASSGVGPLRAVSTVKRRALAVASGAALVIGSACTRFGIFSAGQASAMDPKATVAPQRRRLPPSKAAT